MPSGGEADNDIDLESCTDFMEFSDTTTVSDPMDTVAKLNRQA